jgi:hypothetical protein
MTAGTSRSSSRRTVHRLVTFVPPAIFGIAAAVTLAGCPVGAELEDPNRFAIGTGGTGPGTGGTGPATGGTAGSGTAGTAGSGTAGSGGAGGIVTPNVTCDGGADYVATLTENCARTGCHNTRTAVAGLDLTPNADLAMRLKNQPAGYAEIDCSMGGPYVECVPATCPPPGDALLVDSANPDNSWLLRKLNGTHNACGVVMPVSPGDRPPAPAGPFDDARKACLDKLVRAIAAL